MVQSRGPSHVLRESIFALKNSAILYFDVGASSYDRAGFPSLQLLSGRISGKRLQLYLDPKCM